MKNILEYLDNAALRFPDKIAAKDEKTQCTYDELRSKARQIGTYVAKRVPLRKPVVVFMEKSVETLQIFMGIVSAGDFYVLVDPSFPLQRITQILGVLEPEMVITKPEYREKLAEVAYEGTVVEYAQIDCVEDEALLLEIR